ncbi:MAG: hypothetical protein QOE70_4296 [Chthoniobacter sp.]|jgi:predicted O-methyltransferase YrrM|nr:hypothetical protein [Chthoniobacter sp.]
MNELGDWLKHFDDAARRERVWQLGLLTGLRAEKDGSYRPANFERGLVLDRLVELRKPRAILEIGTGRGLGAFAMAAAAREYGVESEITTADIIPLSQPQDYALEAAGERKRIRASCAEIWARHLDPELVRRIKPLTGPTTATLPGLLREGRTFDLVFIDAGHDLFSVAHDLAYSAALLAPGGAILMDDFAPLEEFGLGTCVALAHARRLFAHVELFPSEGLVFGGTVHPEAPRGMIFLAERRGEIEIRRALLPLWRAAGFLLERCYSPRFFPARVRE